MEHKTRYCPHCGSKTNDKHCEICDRMTRSVEERFRERELDLVADDIASFDHIQSTHQRNTNLYSNDPEDIQENLDMVGKNVTMRNTRRKMAPLNTQSYTDQSSRDIQNQKYTIMRFIAIVILVSICISIFILITSI